MKTQEKNDRSDAIKMHEDRFAEVLAGAFDDATPDARQVAHACLDYAMEVLGETVTTYHARNHLIEVLGRIEMDGAAPPKA